MVGTPKSAGSSGPVLRPRLFGSSLSLALSRVCPIVLYPIRVSSSVFDESVEFHTRPNRAVFCGGLITVFHKLAGPTSGGGVIVLTLPVGADWFAYPKKYRPLIRLFFFFFGTATTENVSMSA